MVEQTAWFFCRVSSKTSNKIEIFKLHNSEAYLNETGNELMSFYKIFGLCAGFLFSCMSLAESAAPAQAPHKNVFNVKEYRVEGNTLLPAIRIEEALYPFTGADKTIDDVEAARSALGKAYHDAGYLTVLVGIPEQTVSAGIVRLKVLEGSVEKVRVVGAQYHDRSRILGSVPSLARGSVPYFPEVQQQMADANRAADIRVVPVLKAGQTPGMVEAELRVNDKLPLHASLELNNYASANTTPLRLTAMVRYDNLWQREHSLSVQYQTSPGDLEQVKVLSATYLMPLPESANQLALYSVVSRSNVAAVGDLSLIGQGNIFGARWVMPMPAREKFSHSVTLGVDYKDFRDDTLLAGSNTGHTPISYMPFSVGYNASSSDAGGMTSANLTANFQLRGVADQMTDCGGQYVSQFECKRYNAKPGYFYLRGSIERTQGLSENLSLFAKVGVQIAGGPLISNEQFVGGGADSVRGYFEAEQAGDDGAHSTLELRGPQWARGEISELRMVTFVDAAHLRVKDPLPSQTAQVDLFSGGLGLRMQGWTYFNLRMDVAWPYNETLYTHVGEPRLGLKMSMIF